MLRRAAIDTITRSQTRCTKTTLTSTAKRSFSAAGSPWSSIPMAPPDPILGLSEAFAKDDYPQKVILGVGAYRGDDGKPLVLPCVRDAEEIIRRQNLNHEYAGIVSHVISIILSCYGKCFSWMIYIYILREHRCDVRVHRNIYIYYLMQILSCLLNLHPSTFPQKPDRRTKICITRTKIRLWRNLHPSHGESCRRCSKPLRYRRPSCVRRTRI